MSVVVDSSVAAKWFLEEGGSAEAEALLERDNAIAPDLVVAEVLNAIWKNVRMGRIVPAQMKFVAAALPGRFSLIVPLHAVAVRAGEIAIELDHPIYDCLYVALAEQERCAFVTADERLYRKTRRTKFAKIVALLVNEASSA